MAKEVKKVKCKGCKLTYDKKLYECPCCHKKRFNFKRILIILIIIAIAGGIIYFIFGNDIKSKIIQQNIINKTGLLYTNLNVTEIEKNEYKIEFDIVNKSNNDISEYYQIINLFDKYKSDIIRDYYNLFTYEDDNYVIELKILKDEIKHIEYNVKCENDWKTLEIYFKKSDNWYREVDEDGFIIFTYKNK